jgi:anti-sigma regulatory factor (Ser/Thr protein kinase)
LKKFVFNNETEGIYPLTVQIISYIQNIAKDIVDDDAGFRIKIILLELLTNSLKHMGDDVTRIGIDLKNDKLYISKQDKGRPLQINTRQALLTWPLTNSKFARNEIAIYGDGFGTLKGRVKNSNQLEFFTEDFDVQYVDKETIIGLNEHYGLMIIARASDAFSYKHKPGTGVNTFTSVIELKQR